MVSRILNNLHRETIFKFNINDYNNHNRRYLNSLSLASKQFLSITNSYPLKYGNRYLNSLSLVSKQFLSITNRLRFSITIDKQLKHCHIFKRFTNLTSLNLNGFHNNLNLNKILYEMSRFPLQQLTSLNISYQTTFPANGLRAFSQKITTLTSLTCSYIDSINTSDLFLIAECFPLLEKT
ncbi:putative F-box/LRR protein [Trifolium pratense]|uniref:Putative F-box/LRR protein n=1 Tax=Trifolium pratense TaxID=57577 RepID=A0A2K3KZU5_TRIPR|nr:putative F-box/LRR protein [Trifolium pratense]